MSFDLDIANDFAQIVDGLLAVSILNRDSEPFTANNVLRRAVRSKEIAASNGQYLGSDTAFHIPRAQTLVPQLPGWDPDGYNASMIRPGWKIVDADGTWTVLEVGTETLTNRTRFVCRNVSLVYDLTQRVDLQTATWTKSSAGALQATWTTTQANVPCRWNYVSGDNEVDHQLRNQPRRVALFLEQSSLIGPDTRFVATVGDSSVILNVIDWVDAEAIGKLMQVNCEVVPWPLS